MKQEGMLLTCDYPGCTAQVLLKKVGTGETDGGWTTYDKFEHKPEGWGYAHDHTSNIRDLCPDHYQSYNDAIAEFWQPSQPAHAAITQPMQPIAEVEDLQGVEENTFPESVQEPSGDTLSDNDILYTNMPELNDSGVSVKVSGPDGVRVGKVRPNDKDQEDW